MEILAAIVNAVVQRHGLSQYMATTGLPNDTTIRQTVRIAKAITAAL